MAKYNNAEEITKAFIEDGWGEDTKFKVLTYAEAEKRGVKFLFQDRECKGHQYYIQNVSENIYDDNGKLVIFGL
jgi:Zn/Cd-binding protein ZinT